VWSRDLLQQCVDFGTKNTDLVFSFGMALMLLKEHMSRKPKLMEDGAKGFATRKLIRQADGSIRIVANGGGSPFNLPDRKIRTINMADFASYSK
jgi:hypothetical protein